MDGSLLIRILATYQPGTHYWQKAFWILMFIFIDIVLRTIHTVSDIFHFIEKLKFCALTVNQYTAIASNIAVCTYASIMGIYFMYVLWKMSNGNKGLLLTVGYKSTVIKSMNLTLDFYDLPRTSQRRALHSICSCCLWSFFPWHLPFVTKRLLTP